MLGLLVLVLLLGLVLGEENNGEREKRERGEVLGCVDLGGVGVWVTLGKRGVAGMGFGVWVLVGWCGVVGYPGVLLFAGKGFWSTKGSTEQHHFPDDKITPNMSLAFDHYMCPKKHI